MARALARATGGARALARVLRAAPHARRAPLLPRLATGLARIGGPPQAARASVRLMVLLRLRIIVNKVRA